MPKNKPHKGLLKRVRVTKSGKIKLQRAWGRHLRSHKTGQAIRQYRLPKYASGADGKRLRSLLNLKASAPKSGPAEATTPSPKAARTPATS